MIFYQMSQQFNSYFTIEVRSFDGIFKKLIGSKEVSSIVIFFEN